MRSLLFFFCFLYSSAGLAEDRILSRKTVEGSWQETTTRGPIIGLKAYQASIKFLFQKTVPECLKSGGTKVHLDDPGYEERQDQQRYNFETICLTDEVQKIGLAKLTISSRACIERELKEHVSNHPECSYLGEGCVVRAYDLAAHLIDACAGLKAHRLNIQGLMKPKNSLKLHFRWNMMHELILLDSGEVIDPSYAIFGIQDLGNHIDSLNIQYLDTEAFTVNNLRIEIDNQYRHQVNKHFACLGATIQEVEICQQKSKVDLPGCVRNSFRSCRQCERAFLRSTTKTPYHLSQHSCDVLESMIKSGD